MATDFVKKMLPPLAVSVLASFVYVLMEWLFFVTKPSILNYYSGPEKISSLFLGALLVALVCFPLVLLSGVIASSLARASDGKSRALCWVVPALLLAATAFLLIDNFTNTLLGFFSGSAAGLFRYAYGLLFLLLLVYCLMKLHGMSAARNMRTALPMALVIAGVGMAFGLLNLTDVTDRESHVGGAGGENLPNILILSSDGINAANMSAFGYERQTTPFIDSLLPESLVFPNHFTNAANTTGSVPALLTGRLPTTNRVVYPPDTLRGEGAYRHLPGLLRGLGYTNGDISVRYYADTGDLNLQGGFDYINGREYRPDSVVGWTFQQLQSLFPLETQFLKQSYDRISSRLLYVSGLGESQDPYTEVTAPTTAGQGIDDDRIAQLLGFVDKGRTPFFLHVHLMGTHGPRFIPKQRHFSLGREQSEGFMVDFYDDAIREFDGRVETVVRELKDRGLYKNTLLIINTDHAWNSSVGHTLPLIIRFPDQQYIGWRYAASQRVDIAPTILDYLGLEVPSWMDGDSLLDLPADSRRYFFASGNAASGQHESGHFQVLSPRPPFYTLGRLFLMDCQKMYQMKLDSGQLSERVVSEYARPCEEESLLTRPEARALLLTHLQEKGYITAESEGLWEDRSDMVPLLSREDLYIPSVDYRGKSHSVMLQKTGDGLFKVTSVGVPEGKPGSAVFDERAGLLKIDVLERNGALYSAVLEEAEPGSLRFSLSELEKRAD